MANNVKITGIVQDTSGNPLDGAIVSTTHDVAYTDMNGYFELFTDEVDDPILIQFPDYFSYEFPSFNEGATPESDIWTMGPLPVMSQDPDEDLAEVEIVGVREKAGFPWWLLLVAGGVVYVANKDS